MKEERTCVACRKVQNKHNMLRIAKVDGKIVIDELGNLQGRGAYICKQADCFNLCLKKKCLNRTFKCNVEQDVYERLLNIK